MADKPKNVIVQVDPELHKRARQLSLDTGRPLSEIIRELLRERVAEHEQTLPRKGSSA